MTDYEIPKEVRAVLALLEAAGHEAYVVGGCVRDILRGARPNDWDVTTSAHPDAIQEIFPDSFYENHFLTVTVRTGTDDSSLKEIEVTTFRGEGTYVDLRHPNEVHPVTTLAEDLERRDFTINAMAINLRGELTDLFGGMDDLEGRMIRAVGDPALRFGEDALRMMRAVRFATQLDFEIESETKRAIVALADGFSHIASERIRDELTRIIMTSRAKAGIELLCEVGLLKYVIPELEEGINAENRPLVYTIWEHNLKALDYGVSQDYSFDVRIAALLHDVGKPRTRGPKKRGEWTFYGHDVVGGKMAERILSRLHFPRAQVEKIATLIRWHLFKYELDTDNESTTDAAIRRIIRRVGAENVGDLVKLRICDRMGMGVPKPVPYRLRHFQFRVEKVLEDEAAPTPKMLAVNGADVMRELGISPGPKIGAILEVLLQEAIDAPESNARDGLLARIRELGTLDEMELREIAERAEAKIELVEDERVAAIKAKHHIT